jgi:putative transcriptional regulator
MTPPPTGQLSLPTHHVPEHGLVEYVAGAATDGAALAFACHVSLCGACAAEVAALENVGGSILEASPGQELGPGALESLLARLETTPQLPTATAETAAVPAVVVPSFLADCDLPAPLLRALPSTKGWRTVVPGMRVVDLPFALPGGAVRLVRFKGGVTIPFHDHGGPEYIVVFTGALEEKSDGLRFGRGDVSIRLPGERHEQRATPGEACVALVVNEGALRPLTLRGRLLLAIARD